MNHKKHNIKDDDETTIWKNQKYFIPNTTKQPSSDRKNDFNYANIQLPTLDGFFRPLSSSSSIEPLTTIEPEEIKTTDSISSGETLSFDGKPSPDNPRTPTLSASLTPRSGVLTRYV